MEKRHERHNAGEEEGEGPSAAPKSRLKLYWYEYLLFSSRTSQQHASKQMSRSVCSAYVRAGRELPASVEHTPEKALKRVNPDVL